MKYLLIFILVVLLAKAVPYYVDHSEDKKLEYTSLSETDIVEFNWAESASYAEGCFSYSFYISPYSRTLYGNYISDKTHKYCNYVYENFSYNDYRKICELVNSMEITAPKVKKNEDVEEFALDETEKQIYLVRKNGKREELRFTDYEAEKQLRELFTSISKKGKKE